MEREDLKNIAIHCKTEDEANKVRTIAQNLGWKWNTGKDYTDTEWLIYNNLICYDFYKGCCAAMHIYEDFGYDIMPAQWFLDNFGDKEQKNLYFYSYGSKKPLLEKGGANISRYCDYTRGFFYMPINGGIIDSVGDSAYKIIRYVKEHGIDLTPNPTLDDEQTSFNR